MASEALASFSLMYRETAIAAAIAFLQGTDFADTLSTLKYTSSIVSVGFAAEEAIPLGEVSSLGWFAAKNLDTTNYVEIRHATGASNDIVKLLPNNGGCMFHWGSDVTAPYWIADTAAVRVQFLLIST